MTLIDVNDNAPMFLPSFPTSSEVREDITFDTPVLAIGATDADDGSNAALIYNIIDGNLDGKDLVAISCNTVHT